MPTAQRKHRPFDAAFADVVQDLIDGTVRAVGQRKQLVDVRSVEVGDAPAHDLPVATQPLERGDGFRQRDAATPVQQIKIEPISAQPAQAPLTRRDRAARTGVVWIHFADDKNIVAPAIHRFAEHVFGAAVAVHFGSVDERHPGVDSRAKRRNFLRPSPRGFAHAPSTEAERGDGRSISEANDRHRRVACGHQPRITRPKAVGKRDEPSADRRTMCGPWLPSTAPNPLRAASSAPRAPTIVPTPAQCS